MKTAKSRRHIPPLLAALALVLACAAIPSANLSAASGDQSDPLALKSYVDDKISGLDAKISQLSASLQALGNGGAVGQTLDGPQVPGGQSGNASYTPVSAAAGQIILGGEGAEIILRSGSAAAYCPGQNGLSDITQGADVPDGAALSLNHLLIVPRADGRGVRVTADAWFLIKGGYTVN